MKEQIAELAFKAIATREGYGMLNFSDMPDTIKGNYYAVADNIIAAGLLGTGTPVDNTAALEAAAENGRAAPAPAGVEPASPVGEQANEPQPVA